MFLFYLNYISQQTVKNKDTVTFIDHYVQQ